MREALKETAKLKQGVDELKCRWVIFPNAKQYLLPIVDRDHKMVPVFKEDGSVVMDVEIPDQIMDELVRKFYGALASVEENIIKASAEAYADFMSLVRYLLLKNYDLTTEDLSAILTLSRDGYRMLFNNMIRHIVMQ